MRKTSVLHTVCVMMPMAYRASPLRFWAVNGLGILQSAVMAANTVLLAGFVDTLVRSVGKGEADGMLVLWTVLFVAGMIGHQLLNTLFNYILEGYLKICGENFRFAYHQAVSALKPMEFEKTTTLDEIRKAEAGLNGADGFVFHLIGMLDMVPPYLVFLWVYMSSLNAWLLLGIAAAFLPSVFTLYAQRPR